MTAREAPRDVIIFNHIPKAGGTSLIAFFRSLLGEDYVFRHKSRDSKSDLYSPGIESLSPQELDQYDFFAGHFGYGYHRLIKRPVRYLGVVREPLERATSHYLYLRKHGPKHLKAQALEMTFEEYLEYRLGLKSNPMVESCQIELLTGQRDLEQAKKIVVRDYLACCTISQLTEMQKALARLYRRPDLLPQNVNRTEKPLHELTVRQEVRDRLDERFALDREFIDWVSSTFRSNVQHLGR